MRDFLDLSNFKTYTITICSNKLYETRSNLIYLNLKSSGAKQAHNNEPQSATMHQQVLQKIQITIRKYARTGIANESIERSLMLTKQSFVKSLLDFMYSPCNQHESQLLARSLDLLIWIFYNHFSMDSVYLSSLRDTFSSSLDKFLTTFYLYGNRSTSRKATILLNLLINQKLDPARVFANLLLNKLLILMKYLLNFESSAALNWYFSLLHQVMSLGLKKSYDQCIGMLTKLSSGHKYNPFYALLKMRFNYSSLVFDSKLFDTDLYFRFDFNEQKFSNHMENLLNQSTFNSNLTQQQQLQQQQQQQQTSQQLVSNTMNAITFSFGSVGLSVNNNPTSVSNNNNNNNGLGAGGNSNNNNANGNNGSSQLNNGSQLGGSSFLNQCGFSIGRLFFLLNFQRVNVKKQKYAIL